MFLPLIIYVPLFTSKQHSSWKTLAKLFLKMEVKFLKIAFTANLN